MRSHVLTLLALLSALASPAASQAASPTAPDAAMMAPVQRWIDAFNAAQTPLPEDVFARDVVITDQFAPYAWSGTAGMHAWSESLNGFLRNKPSSDEHVVVESPRAFMLSKDGNRASFVLPATLTYVVDGKPGTDRALWLFVVIKENDGWKIVGDTWTRTDS